MKLKIEKQENQNIWFTSDIHFYHKNITKFSPESRLPTISSFNSLDEIYKNINNTITAAKEMTEYLIRDWNNTVAYDDIVFHVGDFSFGDIKQTLRILDRLNGQIYFVLGNHDYDFIDNIKHDKIKLSTDYLELQIEDKFFCLFHYPIFEWNRKFRNSIHLYGHIHQRDYQEQLGKNAINVGWDRHCRILNLDDILRMTK